MTDVETQNMAERLKAALEFRGLSQKDLSEMTGINESCISRYVNNERIPRTDKAIKICDALNVTLDWYVNGYCKRCKRKQDDTCIGCRFRGEG